MGPPGGGIFPSAPGGGPPIGPPIGPPGGGNFPSAPGGGPPIVGPPIGGIGSAARPFGRVAVPVKQPMMYGKSVVA